MKTLSESRRDSMKKMISEILKDEELFVHPKSIVCTETSQTRETRVSFSFEEKVGKKVYLREFHDICGDGFVDCIFKTCYEFYSKEYRSIEKIKLVDLLVQPIFFTSRTKTNADAKTNIVLKVEVGDHGEEEFINKSRSIIHSSLVNILSAFEFYVNCERCFVKLKPLISEARNRNRFDLAQEYIYKISEFTRFNNYEH